MLVTMDRPSDTVLVEWRYPFWIRSRTWPLSALRGAEVVVLRNHRPAQYHLVLVFGDGSRFTLLGGSDGKGGKERATWAVKRFLAFSGAGV